MVVSQTTQVLVGKNVGEVSNLVGRYVAEQCSQAISRHDKFVVALSGGSMPKIVGEGLSTLAAVDFTKWHVFFADERCVPLNHPDSNYKACQDAFFANVRIPHEQIYTIDPRLNPSDAAAAYAKKLSEVCGGEGSVPVLDLILLGMGPDGHTCSLFPGHPLLSEKILSVAAITDSPKPPPCRITLTYPVLNTATAVAFIATGESKADLMRPMLGYEEVDPSRLPAAGVRPTTGALHWFLDTAAARKLPEITTSWECKG